MKGEEASRAFGTRWQWTGGGCGRGLTAQGRRNAVHHTVFIGILELLVEGFWERTCPMQPNSFNRKLNPTPGAPSLQLELPFVLHMAPLPDLNVGRPVKSIVHHWGHPCPSLNNYLEITMSTFSLSTRLVSPNSVPP